MNKITKTFTITAPEDVMLRFERFLGFFHYNGGHSGLFAMEFDGDGSDFMKVSPEPPRDKNSKDGYSDRGKLSGLGADVEVAAEDWYDAYMINRDHQYRVRDGEKFKYMQDGRKYKQNEKREWVLID